MRFTFVDSVVERQPDCVVAIKNVSSAEEYLADHFPAFPVLPGVLMLETMVQAARHLVDHDPAGRWVLSEVRNLRYGRFVQPGQSLRVRVRARQRQAGEVEFEGQGQVEHQVAVQGRFRLRRLSLERTRGGMETTECL